MNNISEQYIRNSLKKTLSLVNELLSSKIFIDSVLEATNIIINALSNDNCIYLAGNGGSAALAQHFAAELISRFNFDRNPLPSIALTTDSSIITAVANDYGYEKVFERQLAGLAKNGDVFIGFSTSGNSPNIINAINKANEMGLMTIGMCGVNGIKGTNLNVDISIPSQHTPLIQEMHGVTSHLICDLVEKSIFSN